MKKSFANYNSIEYNENVAENQNSQNMHSLCL